MATKQETMKKLEDAINKNTNGFRDMLSSDPDAALRVIGVRKEDVKGIKFEELHLNQPLPELQEKW